MFPFDTSLGKAVCDVMGTPEPTTLTALRRPNTANNKVWWVLFEACIFPQQIRGPMVNEAALTKRPPAE